jgi:uncharacterized membrane protein
LNLGYRRRDQRASAEPDILWQKEAAMALPCETQRPIVPDNMLAIGVGLLYLAGYFTGITALIGAIIAHIKADDPDPVLRSHYRFQVRTFWIGLLYLVIGTLLCLVLIGFLILAWWFIWSLIRIIKSIVMLNEGRPIADPGSWLFGSSWRPECARCQQAACC